MIWLSIACLAPSGTYGQQFQMRGPLLDTTAAGNPIAQQRRPLVYDDLLRLERLGREYMGQPVAFSPDGSQLAYVRVRPKHDATVHDQPYLWGNDRADIWLASTSGGEASRITTGTSDGFGYWAPSWSPDGEHLALLSTRDDNIRVHVWQRETGDVTRLSERGTDPSQAEPVWLSSSEIVFTVLPEGERPSALDILRRTPEIATEAWPKVREGIAVTSSVLESGVPVELASRPHGQLLTYDLRSREARVLFDGYVRDVVASPDNDLVAGLVMTDVFLPQSEQPLAHRANHGRYQIRLFNRNGVVPAERLSAVKEVIPGSLEWAPDGSNFAFAGSVEEAGPSNESESEESEHEIFVFTPTTGALDRYPLGELNPFVPAIGFVAPPKIRWSAAGHLLLHAREQDSERTDWWLIQPAGERRNLTRELDSAPSELYRVEGEASWVGLSEGDVWRIPEDGAEPTNLTAVVSEEVTALAWPDEERAKTSGVTEVIVRGAFRSGESSLYRIELPRAGGAPARPQRLEKPRPSAELVDFSGATGLAVFGANDRTGSYLWLAPLASSEPRLLFETNHFLREIAEAESRRIEYRSSDGDSLSAWIMLPPDCAEKEAAAQIDPTQAQRYPLVVWVYAGSTAREDGPRALTELNYPHPLNRQLLTAKGYAVLMPSMPLERPGKPSDPYMELTKGVLPAVDRAIELGIADPERLAVMGQSYGGYSTYGLVTQTDRFDAAIALAGLSNLISLYGQFNGRIRYDERPHERLFNMSISETGQLRMGGPPWQDLQRYIRNSPITYVDRVNTPLLIIQGDLDYVAVQQAEEFFMALYRQGKRANFIRYWGEGHVLSSPANIKDMWRHIFAWLDEHLNTKERPSGAEAAAAR